MTARALMDLCFHCHQPLTGQVYFVTDKAGEQLPMCCIGCKVVTETILTLGLNQFYQYRDVLPKQALSDININSSDYESFNSPEIYQQYVDITNEEKTYCQSTLFIEGINCTACAWLIENRLLQMDGIISCQVNYTNQFATIEWNNSIIQLSDIFAALSAIGYKAHLSQLLDLEKNIKATNRKSLIRLGVAGFGMMQVMMMAIGLYAGAFTGIESSYRSFLQWVSMMITLPIFVYVSQPFIKNAYFALKHKRLVMDLPISIALVAILLQSLLATLYHQGEVYFDSICMFLFFLTLGRYLEMRARHKSSEVLLKLMKLIPSIATKVTLENNKVVDQKLVPIEQLQIGDVVSVAEKQTFPADGLLMSEATTVNESMLTGEFLPKKRIKGDAVSAGTIQLGEKVLVKITKIGGQTKLMSIARLLEKAQRDHKIQSPIADRFASYFIAFVLVIASITGFVWFQSGSERWLEIALSVLVVACPCALSLATPIALTVAINTLSKKGLLILKSHILENLSAVKYCFFDKTGTLTKGQLSLDEMVCHGSMDKAAILKLACQLEQMVSHPVAHVFQSIAEKNNFDQPLLKTEHFLNAGVEGTIDGNTYRIGKPDFVLQLQATSSKLFNDPQNRMIILLGEQRQILASFYLSDQIRSVSEKVIKWLRNKKIEPILLTGDGSQAVDYTAARLGIKTVYKDQSPEQKYQVIKNYSEQGFKTMVVGDGSNDSIAMGAADISFSMGTGTVLAKTASDGVILNDDLSLIKTAAQYSEKTQKIIRQNMIWSIGYNLLAMPVAILGWVEPFVAVIGMSFSSIIVTVNALRLRKGAD